LFRHDPRSEVRALLRRGLSLDRLASFAAIASNGGFARAAPGDPSLQSQLSRQLKELEVALGFPLLERTPNGLQPTRAGAALLRAVRTLSRELDEVGAVAAGARRKVVLGAGDSVLQWLVLPRLAALRLDALDLEVVALSADGTVSALQEERIELGLLRASEASGDFKTVRLGQVEYGLYESKRGLPLAVATSERGVMRELEQLDRPARLRCETFPQVAQAVRAGTHCGVLPTFAAPLLGGHIKRVEAPGLERASSPLALAWRARVLERRPDLAPLRHRLEVLLRQTLKRA
jgi:DNA-binding transcriptional LysR family regulator